MNLNTSLNALLNAPTGPPQDRPVGIPGFGPSNNATMQQQPPHGMQQQPMQQHPQQQQSMQMPPSGPQQAPQQPQQQQQAQGDQSLGQPGAGPPALPQQPREQLNAAQLCRLGQETVQEIVSKTQEVFQSLKTMQLPIGTQNSTSAQEERRGKLNETMKYISALFKRLRKIYEKCCEACEINEYIQMESLIPLRDDHSSKIADDRKNTEQVKRLDEERKMYTEQLKLRNRQLKETIDKLRELVWEINTMLAMRKP